MQRGESRWRTAVVELDKAERSGGGAGRGGEGAGQWGAWVVGIGGNSIQYKTIRNVYGEGGGGCLAGQAWYVVW